MRREDSISSPHRVDMPILAEPKASSSDPPQTSIFLGWGVSDLQMIWTVKTASVSEWCWGQEEVASGRRSGAANRDRSLFYCKEAKRGWTGAERPPSWPRPPRLLWLLQIPQFINTAGFRHDPISRAQLHTTVESCAPRGTVPVAVWWFSGRPGRRKFKQTLRDQMSLMSPLPPSCFSLDVWEVLQAGGRSPGLKLFCLEYSQCFIITINGV